MHYIVKTFILLSTLLFLGACSGHTLQDWADENFNNKNPKTEAKSPEKEVTAKTDSIAEVDESETKEDLPPAKTEQSAEPEPAVNTDKEKTKMREDQAELSSVQEKEPLSEAKVESKKPAEVKSDVSASPSQNPQLNAVSPSDTATSEGGAMQKSLDTWTEEEWTPTVEQNETIKAMNEDKDRPFTLQEYVDKAGVYMDNKPKSDEPAHYEEMEKLPVIGK